MAKKSKHSLNFAFSQMKRKTSVKSASSSSVTKSPKTIKCSSEKSSKKAVAKKGFHQRNIHRDGYDFEKLIVSHPNLKRFVNTNAYGNLSVDFSDPNAVKTLNSALLKYHYGIEYWDIPKGFLCPPIPGRVDYIHYVADILGKYGKSRSVRLLDIGTGANGIYPILGARVYGWDFVGSDIDPKSLENLEKIIKCNPSLQGKISTRLQSDPKKIFHNIIKDEEKFDVTICNPPFHSSLEEALKGNRRKVKNLAKSRGEKPEKNSRASLNFGGQKAELWCEGGEKQFLLSMIRESADFSSQCRWFTSLVSLKDSLKPCYFALKKVGAKEVKTIEMVQGNKITRILAWSFFEN